MSATAALKLDYLANITRAYALEKADAAAGIIIADVLYQTKASVRDLATIKEAEPHVREWLAAYLESTITEFTEAYTKELQRQVEHHRGIVEDALNTQLTPKILTGPLIERNP